MESSNQNEKTGTIQKKTEEENYFQYLISVIKNPDAYFTTERQGYRQFGLITIISFLVLVVISSFTRVSAFWDTLQTLGISDYFSYFSRGISYAIALAILMAVFKNMAEKNGFTYDFDFFLEKMGALLVYPGLFLLLSLPLNLLDVTIHSWVSSLAYTFLYLAVFLTSYLFVAKNNVKTAFLFVAGFYLVYRVIYYLL